MIGDVLGDRYRLDAEIGRGGIGIVYRAYDLLLERDVAVKILDDTRLGPSTLDRFLREARFIAPLTHPNIVAVYDASRAGDRPYIVMELLRGVPLSDQRPEGLKEIVDIARQVCLALDHAHEHGIIHRDLKPGNIMIEPGRRVKLVDFGVAYHETSQMTDEDVIIGTVFYLSPEQALGKEITPQTDLYALGVVLYELVTGGLPFADESPMTVITRHIHAEAPRPSAARPGIPPRLDDLIVKMLRKTAGDRPASAQAVIAELEAIDLDAPEPENGRAGALTTAESLRRRPFEDRPLFVSREAELQRLDDHLAAAIAGSGHILFVTGSAGIGKTTLLAEFSSLAQDRYPELLVATGSCNAHSGVGDPFLPFREVFNMLTGDVESRWAAGRIARDHAHRLIDAVPYAIQALVDHGPSLLDSFVPLDTLDRRLAGLQLNRSAWQSRLDELRGIKSKLALSGNSVQTGFYEEYRNVLVRISQRNPLLIVLDDLHWVDISSVGLLFHLARRIPNQRILIVGTYRPEDINLGWGNQPHPMRDLTTEFGREFGDIWIRLETGGAAAGRRFVDALIDASPNRIDPDFRNRLAGITGGHPLFTTELLAEMRSRGDLVQEDDGRWVAVGEPNWEILPSRVEAVIERRIDRLSPDLRRTLAIASVEGVSFTAEVVSQVLARDPAVVSQTLGTELDAQHHIIKEEAVRRLQHRKVSEYSFRHALFQRYIYEHIDEAQKSHLHLHVAEALEEIYREEPEKASVRLAYHFSQTQSPERALEYLNLAGQRALSVSGYEEAVGFLRQAEQIEAETGVSVSGAEKGYRELLAGQALVSLSQYDEGRSRLEKGLALLGRPIPSGGFTLALSVLAQLLSQVLIHNFPKRFVGRYKAGDETVLVAAYRAYERLAEVSYFAGEVLVPLYTVLRILNSAELHGLEPEMARGYAGTGALFGFIPLHGTARSYIGRAIEISNRIDDAQSIVVISTVASYYLAGIGEWATAKAQSERCIALAESIGDLRNLMDGLSNDAAISYFQGDFHSAARTTERVAESGRNAGHSRVEVQGLLGTAFSLLHLNRLDETLALLETIDRAIDTEENQIAVKHMQLEREGIHCAVLLRQERYDEAFTTALATYDSASSNPNYPTAYLGYTEPLEVFLRSWELGHDRPDLKKLVAGGLKKMRAFARVFPIGRPRLRLLEGLSAWVSGSPGKAQSAWEASLRDGEALGMRYEAGRTHLEIGRHLGPEDPGREEHLDKAGRIFRELSAELEAARVKRLLAGERERDGS